MGLTAEAEKAEDTSQYNGEDRRKDDKTARALFDLQRGHKAMSQRLNDGDTRMGNLESAVKKNTEITENIKTDTSEIVEFAQSIKGFVRVAEMVGKLARPLGYILAAFAAGMGLISTFKSGHWGGGR